MKHATITATLAAAILAGATAQAIAEGHGMKRDGHGPRPAFEELDADGDGGITRDEMKAHMAARFARADADGDGLLTRDEMLARAEEQAAERRAKRIDRMMDRLDADGDSALSLAEMQARADGRRFDRADADGDGRITKAEMEEMRAKHKGARQQQGQ
jgi:Ca2+-binding EF-hand superfamily protein